MIARIALRLLADHGGNFATIAAAATLPVAAIAGLAMDYSRMRQAESRLQSAVDAGVVAAAASGGTSAAMQRMVLEFVQANIEAVPDRAIAVDTFVDSNRLRAEASFMLSLPVLSLVGIAKTEIRASASLASDRPLRAGDTRIDRAQRQEVQREIQRMIARMPPRKQARMRARLRRMTAEAQARKSRRPARTRLSR